MKKRISCQIIVQLDQLVDLEEEEVQELKSALSDQSYIDFRNEKAYDILSRKLDFDDWDDFEGFDLVKIKDAN